jgi:hypothetical protein
VKVLFLLPTTAHFKQFKQGIKKKAIQTSELHEITKKLKTEWVMNFTPKTYDYHLYSCLS